MGAGRRPHPSSGGSPSSSSSSQFLNLPVGELASVIFGCSNATYEECINQLIFGLPFPHFNYIKNVQSGMPVFLFNYSNRKLHGIYEAESCGDLNINPYAWTNGRGGKTDYPAQVRVRVRQRCSPLPEKVFKEAIVANYYKVPQTHFYFELNHEQTDFLLSLFTRNITSLAGPSSRPQGDEQGLRNRPKRSAMDAWDNALPFMPTPAQASPAQSEGRAATPEQWDDGCENMADETTAGSGGSNSEDAINKSLEPTAEESVDWRLNVRLSNVKLSEGEEDHRKTQRELEVFEGLKQRGKMPCSVEVKAEFPQVQDKSQKEASVSGSSESTKVQDPTVVEWEKLARERCLQEQTMLREEREQLREKLQALDAPVAKTISKNLELCASAIAQMRQDEIKLRHVMHEAINLAELLRELDQLKNATLEYSQQAAILGGDYESTYCAPIITCKDRMVQIPYTAVAKVKKVLEYNACKCLCDLTSLDEITLAKEVTLDQFQKWATTNAERKQQEWGLKIEYVDGRIIGTELAGWRNHAWAVGRLLKMFIRQDQNDDLEFGVEENVDFAQGQRYTADVLINVKGNYVGLSLNLVNLRGHGFTVAVVEIGVAQSGSDLCKKLELYGTIPSLQFYVAIKRYAADGMVALKFERANLWQPMSIISFGMVPLHTSVVSYIQGEWPGQPIVGVGFGGPACDIANLAPYIIPLPSATIFIERQGGVPVAAPGAYKIDLFEMSQLLGI